MSAPSAFVGGQAGLLGPLPLFSLALQPAHLLLHFALMAQTSKEDGAKAESNFTFSLREVYSFLAATYFHIFNKQH